MGRERINRYLCQFGDPDIRSFRNEVIEELTLKLNGSLNNISENVNGKELK